MTVAARFNPEPLGRRSPRDPMRMSVVVDGKSARTRFRTLTVYTDIRRVTDALAIDSTDTVTVNTCPFSP